MGAGVPFGELTLQNTIVFVELVVRALKVRGK